MNKIIASFDVDAQCGFTPMCPDELPVNGGDEIVPALNAQAEFAQYRVFSKDWHNPGSVWVANKENPQFSEVGLPNSDIRWNKHCIGGTVGAELLPGLPNYTEYDYGVYKGLELDMHPYGACYHDLAKNISTGAIEFLKSKNVTTVIVGGLALDFCVKETALELRAAGFEVLLNMSATRGIAPESIQAALDEMEIIGITIIENTKKLKNYLEK